MIETYLMNMLAGAYFFETGLVGVIVHVKGDISFTHWFMSNEPKYIQLNTSAPDKALPENILFVAESAYSNFAKLCPEMEPSTTVLIQLGLRRYQFMTIYSREPVIKCTAPCSAIISPAYLRNALRS